MPKINYYVIDASDKEAKKDFIDRHSVFIYCENNAKIGEKFKIKVKVGKEYTHPDDFDHFIKYVQLWNGETLMGETNFPPGTLGNISSNVEVDFYIISNKKKLKLKAMAYCTKHGLWQSDEKIVNLIK